MAVSQCFSSIPFVRNLAIITCMLNLTCCDDSDGVEPDFDTGEDTPVADSAEDTAADTGGTETAREAIAFAVTRSCIGCDTVSWCGMPPRNDATALTLDAAPNNESGDLFAAERWEAHGRGLPVDTCQVFEGDFLEPVVTPPSGLTILDGGSVQVSGEMPALSDPIAVDYHDVTHNYNSTALLIDVETDYSADSALALDADGGADLPAFSAAATSCDTMEILTPHTNASGQIANIPTDEDLEVTWTGGSDFDDIVIILEAYYCPFDWTAMVICNAVNDGAFTIDASLFADIDWANVAELHLIQSHKHLLDVDGLDDEAAWSIRSEATVPVYHDPEATPVEFDCTSVSMQEDYVGEPCANDSDCGGGCCLPAVADVYFYDGYCSLLHCDGDADCPADAACVQNPHPQVPWDMFCAKLCDDDTDCRFPEYACLGTNEGVDVCRPNFW